MGEEIDDHLANLVIAQLLFLEAEDPARDIWLYINSPGGSITSGLAIYDTLQFVKPDINTICVGQAASMAALLLSAGTKGKRFALPNSRIVIHQPMGGASGQATDIDIQAREILSDEGKYFPDPCRPHGAAPRDHPDGLRPRFHHDPQQARTTESWIRSCQAWVGREIKSQHRGIPKCVAPEGSTMSRGYVDNVLRCSFCDKPQREVKKLIAGPNVYICNECVETCNEILSEDTEKDEKGTQPPPQAP